MLRSICLTVFVVYSFHLSAYTAQDSTAKPPDTVKIGTYVISVHDINFHDKQYTIRFWLWLLYNNPAFDFSKQIDIPNAKTIEQPNIIVDSVDGNAWVMMKMKCD